MKTHLKKSRYIFVTVLGVALCSAYGVGVVIVKRQNSDPDLPKVISKVKNLEVVSATVKRENGAPPVISVTVRNKSDKAVVAVDLESGDESDAGGIDFSGFKPGDAPPATIIEPFGVKVLEISLGEVLQGKPLKIGGAIYADGSEDGDEITLRTMHGHRDHDKRATTEGKDKSQTTPEGGVR